ncbi:hypothetical protein LJE71_13525 [Xanthobacter autotrophicus]|uniref:hypothetical protein n=1 Tax=Xanthobacter autotrophicus TaxID=280 RepID=UPI001E2EA273|nr:hypothetical protein [Xanthobacter autotrophicus]UDQ87332.1 hypothetical protein LJE71_13525 [Xanthobacter autotrophicus]
MASPVDLIRAQRAQILDEARRKAAALDLEARDLEKAIALLDKYGYVAIPKSEVGSSDEYVEVNASGAAYKAAISVAERAIRDAGRPLELRELYESCVNAGVTLSGKRPQGTLSAFLSHPSSTVRSIRRGIYWLKDVDPPEGFVTSIPTEGSRGADGTGEIAISAESEASEQERADEEELKRLMGI